MNRRDLTIVNALGILDNPNAEQSLAAASQLNPSSDQLSIDERTLTDAHASGLTAVNITLGYTMGEMEPYAHTLEEIAVWDRHLAEHPADLTKVLKAADIDRARVDGKVGVIYGFQNAVAVGDDVGRVAEFERLGVRVIQLTYNQANHLGDGSMAPDNGGLTPFGREVVAAINDARVMVDLSHSGERTCLDAIRASREPISINHTGCRALCDLPRNKTDEELRRSPTAAASWASTSCRSSTRTGTPPPPTSSRTSSTPSTSVVRTPSASAPTAPSRASTTSTPTGSPWPTTWPTGRPPGSAQRASARTRCPSCPTSMASTSSTA